MSVSSAASESHHNGSKLNNWEIYRSQLSIDIPSQDEFISDIRRPSLLSVTLTDSVCSNSSFDCNDLDSPEFEEKPVKVPQQSNCQHQKKEHLAQQKSHKTGKINDISKKNLELEDLNISSIVHDPSQKAIMKSLSMHDVSGIPTFSLGMKQNSAASCETIHSQSLSSTTKSKDSGFHRSVSCLSLNSGSRSYDHVQSKVKEYIRGIKESEAQRKKHFVGKQYSDEEKQESTINIDALEPEDLVETISKMELELKEKSVMLDTQQKNYNALLKKLAEAENTIDQLRLRRSSSHFYNSYHSSRDSLYHSQPYSYLNSSNMSLGASVEKTCNFSQPKETSRDCIKQKELFVNNNNSSSSSSSNNNKTINKYSMSPCTIIEKVEAFSPGGCSTPTLQSPKKSELRPLTRLFSSSCRLDRTFTPLTKVDINNTKFDYPSKQSVYQNRPKSEQTGALDQSEECLFSYRNSTQQRRKTLLTNVENHIDLPKVDPFDKVKKWQASLPSIHLLGYDHSTSNSDIRDNNLKSPQLIKTLRRSETIGVSNNSLHELSTTTSSVGRFTKSEQDLSCLKSFSLSGNHLKNSSASSVQKENDRISESKYFVSICSQKDTDMSLPLYLTTYQSSHNAYDNEVNISSGNKRCNELYTTYYNDLPAKSECNSNKNSSLHWSQHNRDGTDHQKPRFLGMNVSCKQAHNITADSQKTECSHAASSYNCYSDSVNFNKNCKREVIGHCYWTQISNELSDYQKQPVTTIFDSGHANCRKKANVKKTSLNSRAVTQSASEFSVSEGPEKNYDNRSDYKMHQRIILTDKLSNGVISERQDSEDIPSVSSSILSSLNEYICGTPSSYKSLNSPKRKKYIADGYVPSKIKKFPDQKQTILPVISSEVENITEKSEQLELSGSKYSEIPSAAVDSSKKHRCKAASKNDFRSLLVNGYEREQSTKSHLITNKLLEERNFLYAKQTPLPVDDMETELVLTDTYRINKSLKESLKDSEYFANLLTVGLRKVKKALEDIQTESRQAVIINNV